jgi:hypothetical protein
MGQWASESRKRLSVWDVDYNHFIVSNHSVVIQLQKLRIDKESATLNCTCVRSNHVPKEYSYCASTTVITPPDFCRLDDIPCLYHYIYSFKVFQITGVFVHYGMEFSHVENNHSKWTFVSPRSIVLINIAESVVSSPYSQNPTIESCTKSFEACP